MKRYLYDPIKKDLLKKMVILTGPRQVGKTWLAKALMPEFLSPQYLNYDNMADARIIDAQAWPLKSDFLILDEARKAGRRISSRRSFQTIRLPRRLLCWRRNSLRPRLFSWFKISDGKSRLEISPLSGPANGSENCLPETKRILLPVRMDQE